MKYNILLTQEENLINAFVLGLPTCNVKTSSRNEAIALIRKNLMSVLKKSEIIQIEVPNKSYTSNIPDKKTTWHEYGYGTFKNDSNWDEIFDEIEINRNDNII